MCPRFNHTTRAFLAIVVTVITIIPTATTALKGFHSHNSHNNSTYQPNQTGHNNNNRNSNNTDNRTFYAQTSHNPTQFALTSPPRSSPSPRAILSSNTRSKAPTSLLFNVTLPDLFCNSNRFYILRIAHQQAVASTLALATSSSRITDASLTRAVSTLFRSSRKLHTTRQDLSAAPTIFTGAQGSTMQSATRGTTCLGLCSLLPRVQQTRHFCHLR